MQERFKQLLEEKNLTATRFAAMIKVNASAMSHILNGRSKPGFDVLDKIAQAFPDVNLNWLISGKGSLYNNRISTPAKEVEKIPVQKNLFEEEEKRFPIEEKNTKAEEILRPAVSVASIPTAKGKKVKRIILFFEDGSLISDLKYLYQSDNFFDRLTTIFIQIIVYTFDYFYGDRRIDKISGSDLNSRSACQ